MTLLIGTLTTIGAMIGCIAVYLTVWLVMRYYRFKGLHDDPNEATDLDYPTTRGHLFKGPLGFNKKWHNKD